MRHAARVDGCHAEIRDGLRKLGHAVHDTSKIGCGVSDLAVVTRRNQRHAWVEIKMPGERLTDAEMWFFGFDETPHFVAHSLDEAAKFCEDLDLEDE